MANFWLSARHRVHWKRVAVAVLAMAGLIAALVRATSGPTQPEAASFPDDEAVRQSLGTSPNRR